MTDVTRIESCNTSAAEQLLPLLKLAPCKIGARGLRSLLIEMRNVLSLLV